MMNAKSRGALWNGARSGLVGVVVLALLPVCGGDRAVGYRVRDVVDVPAAGATAGKVILGDGAQLGKSGAGTWTLQAGNLRTVTDARIAVTEGAVQVTASDEADFTTPPDVCSTAAYWVDVGTNLVTTNSVPAEGETATAFVTKWCDRRETDTASPTRIYAVPCWYGNATYPALLTNVPPVQATFDGRTGVYFGGATSGQYLSWQRGGKTETLTSIRHLFIVHAITNTLGHPVGYGTGGRKGPLLNTIGGVTPGWDETTPILYPRGDICPAQVDVRFHLDGVKCDGHTTHAKRCWQLWECDYFAALPGADNFYRCGFGETLKGRQGGDYLGEVLVFTNRLTEGDCAAIERYLLAKWNLPDDKGLARRRGAAEFALASNTVVTVSGASGTKTPPLAFAGDGTVVKEGEGLLTLGPSEDLDFTGVFAWKAGSLRLAGGRFPAMTVASGERYAFSSHFETERPTRAGDDVSGLTCAKSAAAAAGTVETTGNGWLRVTAVSNDVRTLKVGIKTAGLGSVLQLEGRVRSVAAPQEGALAATFANPDLEPPFAITDAKFDRCSVSSGTVNGWTRRSGAFHLMCIQAPKANNTWCQWLDAVEPQLGSNILQIVQAAAVSTTVSVPKAGVYELSFDAKARYGSSNAGFNKGYAYADQQSQVEILFGKDWSSVERVGTLPLGCRSWNRFRYRVAISEAGSWELGLRTGDNGNDACAFFDNFAMARIPEPAREEICAIPNGNFDRLTRPCDPTQAASSLNPYIHGYFCTLNRFTDWTLDVNTAACYGYALTNGVIGALTTGTVAMKANGMYPFPFADAPEGAGALMLVSTGGTARVSVTVPAGTWRLRGKAEKMPTYWAPNLGGDVNLCSNPKIRARVTRADGASVLDLGQIAPVAQEMRTWVWPTVFTLEAEETVTLALEQSVLGGIAVLDDLELVRESTREGENLLSDPGFEKWSGVWNGYKKPGYTNRYWAAGSYPYADRPQYWGYSVFEGNHRLYLQNAACAYQSIVVPEAGLYRFTMHVRARADSSYHGNNPVRVFMTQGGVTNELATTPTLFTRQWVEVSYLAHVPSAGTWRFHLEGQCRPEILATEEADSSKPADLDAHIDAVSFVRCRDVIDAAPDLPATLKIEVAEGAQLLLDYVGTARCGPVKYAGKVYLGTLDASTYPAFITGLGTLEARSTGTLFLFR